ncbi:hypothetical protein BDD12DRAFT_548548 [Trichophaea hybrida]|nr:hypothetical protein BDD12DRAFT_548548 [Trichophaea hybrida]
MDNHNIPSQVNGPENAMWILTHSIRDHTTRIAYCEMPSSDVGGVQSECARPSAAVLIATLYLQNKEMLCTIDNIELSSKLPIYTPFSVLYLCCKYMAGLTPSLCQLAFRSHSMLQHLHIYFGEPDENYLISAGYVIQTGTGMRGVPKPSDKTD